MRSAPVISKGQLTLDTNIYLKTTKRSFMEPFLILAGYYKCLCELSVYYNQKYFDICM